ncbi:unnamed protein product [Staurois parvus]|uniref:Uncharacterized protein n=1 Tax=Staurois parvus TaxID=386267 RepID=A0ABN9F0X9_9NEOB|nr:unnamed protein product [Staurois parvus]
MPKCAWILKVLLNPGPCIHYIWSPTDPAFTISGLPQYTQHGSAIVVNVNLTTFSHQQLEHVTSISVQQSTC